MVSWFLIILALIGIFIVYKLVTYKHRRPRISMVILLLLILFFASTLYLVSKANNVDMTTLSGFSTGMKVYGIWLVNGFSSLRSITGNAVGLDWAKVNNTAGKPANLTKNVTQNSNQVGVEEKPASSSKNLMKPKPLK